MRGSPRATAEPRRLLSALLLPVVLLLPLSACTDEKSGEAGPTGVHVDGDDTDHDYGESCTHVGAGVADSSVVRDVDGAPEIAGRGLQASLGFTEPGGPSARLVLTTQGSEDGPTEADLTVGESVEHDGWTATVTSICADEVRFDVTT